MFPPDDSADAAFEPRVDPPETRAALFDILFRRSADGIAITTKPTRTGERALEQLNPSGCAILGVHFDQWYGKTPAQLFQKNQALMALFTRDEELTLEVRLHQKRLAVGTGLTLSDGRRMVILHDVTERRDLGSRREAISAAITHDLRNPLMSIAGYLDLALHAEDNSPDQREFMLRSQSAAQKLYEGLNSLTDLAWLEAGMPLKHEPVRLDDVVESTIKKVQVLAAQKTVTFAVAIQHPMPVVMGDSEQLQNALYNIIHNAVIYSFPETVVAIHAWSDDRQAHLTVADQGIGIAQDEIDAIFDRLFRSKDERVRAVSGAGLGLTIARRIAQRHGGTLWVNSTLNKGSTFTLSLPAVEA